MIPYNNRSYYPGRTELRDIGWTGSRGLSNGSNPASSTEQRQSQIQVNSTIDADIVLRRIIEDRAAILALTSRAATNEEELLKAKTRQLHITKTLERQDQRIAKLTTRAKHGIAGYNESSKQYIRSFILAFESGDMDKLPRHPFAPSLEELEQAIKQRKATLVEKVQTDDRVKKLEFISSQERVTMKVIKKNEEAFMRAIEISKQQFSDSCETWFNRANKLFVAMPHHAQRFGDMKKSHTMEASRSHVQAPEKTSQYTPLEKRYVLPQHNSCAFAQELELPQENEFMTPKRSAKRSIEDMSSERPGKKPGGTFQSTNSEFRGKEYHRLPGLVGEESPGSKSQKKNHQLTPESPVIAYHSKDHGANELAQRCPPLPCLQRGPGSTTGQDNSEQNKTSSDQDESEEMSVAQVLTSLQENKSAVSNI